VGALFSTNSELAVCMSIYACPYMLGLLQPGSTEGGHQRLLFPFLQRHIFLFCQIHDVTNQCRRETLPNQGAVMFKPDEYENENENLTLVDPASFSPHNTGILFLALQTLQNDLCCIYC